MADIIYTDTYYGEDRRKEQRVRTDRRQSIVQVYDEFGELSDKLGEVLNITV